jgi:hypothetical protein
LRHFFTIDSIKKKAATAAPRYQTETGMLVDDANPEAIPLAVDVATVPTALPAALPTTASAP